MDWGMKNRLSRIIKPETGHTVMLAVDHGYFLGPTHKLENAAATIHPLLPYADALMLTRGILRTSVDPGSDIPVVLNAAAVALSIFIGTEHEQQTLVNLSYLVDIGSEYGIPVLAVTAVGKELGKRDVRFLALSCRIAAELGASFVKTYYCDEFEKVVESCPVPVVIAGGPKLETELDALQMAHDALQKGAAGVDMGRNIWQSDHPVPMIKAVRAVVHEKASPQQALDIFKESKSRR